MKYLSDPVYEFKPADWKKRSQWRDTTQVYCPDCVQTQESTRAEAAKLRVEAAKLRVEAAKLLKH